MRRKELEADVELGWDVFGRCSVAHLVCAGEVRPVHPVVLDGAVYVHGAVKGEKATWDGRAVTLSAFEIVAEIPSYWRHPERACPATTYYRSAQVHGLQQRVEDLEEKRAVLVALMHRYQPQGGYRDLEDPMYDGPIRGVGVVRIDGEMVARCKVGQKLSAPDRDKVVEGLWQRGAPGDMAAIEAIWAGAPEGAPVPERLRGPGVRWVARIGANFEGSARDLVRHEYWNVEHPAGRIEAAMSGSQVWVGAERDGQLVATARAITDGAKMAWIGDVAVAPGLRGRGIGAGLMRFVLAHPRIRDVANVVLGTRSPEFYAPLGFVERRPREGSTEMVRVRRSAGSQ